MKRYERFSYLFAALAVLLSNVMCAVVAYDHCAMQWGERYAGYSVPARHPYKGKLSASQIVGAPI